MVLAGSDWLPVVEHPNWPPSLLQQTRMCLVLRQGDMVPAASPVPRESYWDGCRSSTLGEVSGWISVSSFASL